MGARTVTKKVDSGGHRVRPQKVLLAMFCGDKGALSEMGKNGALKQQRLRVWRKKAAEREQKQEECDAIYREAYLQRRDAEFRKRDKEANLHICPID